MHRGGSRLHILRFLCFASTQSLLLKRAQDQPLLLNNNNKKEKNKGEKKNNKEKHTMSTSTATTLNRKNNLYFHYYYVGDTGAGLHIALGNEVRFRMYICVCVCVDVRLSRSCSLSLARLHLLANVSRQLLDLRRVELLDIAQQPQLVAPHKCDGKAGAAHAAGATNAVDILLS